jgi:hypothetical protein
LREIEFLVSMYEGLLATTVLKVNPTRGSTGTLKGVGWLQLLGHWNSKESKESVEI